MISKHFSNHNYQIKFKLLHVNKSLVRLTLEGNKIGTELEFEIDSLVERNCQIRDNFIELVREAIRNQNKKPQILTAMKKTPIGHQIDALIEIIKISSESSKEGEDISNHLNMIKLFLDQNVPIDENVLQIATNSNNSQIQQLIVATLEKRAGSGEQLHSTAQISTQPSLTPQSILGKLMASIFPTNKTSTQSSPSQEIPSGQSAIRDKTSIPSLATISIDSDFKPSSSTLLPNQSPIPTIQSTTPPLQPQLSSQPSPNHPLQTRSTITKPDELTQISINDAKFLTQIRIRSEFQGGIVVGREISDLYLKGEESASNRQLVISQRNMILADPNRSLLYTDLQSQLNSILRLIQQANISFVDRHDVVGTDYKEKLVKLLTPLIAKLPFGIGDVTNKIIDSISSSYHGEEFSSKCSKLSNLQGDAERDIRLLSEAIIRRVVLDQELLDSINQILVKQQQDQLSANIFTKLIAKVTSQMPDMAQRIAKNQLSPLSKEAYLITTLIIGVMFEERKFDQRVVISDKVADGVYRKLREELGLEMRPVSVGTKTDLVSRDMTAENQVSLPAVDMVGSGGVSSAVQLLSVASIPSPLLATQPSNQSDHLAMMMEEMRQMKEQQRQHAEQQKQQAEKMAQLEAENRALKAATAKLEAQSKKSNNASSSDIDSDVPVGDQMLSARQKQEITNSSVSSNPLSLHQTVAELHQRMATVEQTTAELQEEVSKIPATKTKPDQKEAKRLVDQRRELLKRGDVSIL